MSRAKVRGLVEANALLDRLPVQARHELTDTLVRIGRDILGRQRDAVAKSTGALGRGLSSEPRSDGKPGVRVGLLGLKKSYARRSRGFTRAQRGQGKSTYRDLFDLYYGRFVEFGRSAQTVLRPTPRRAGETKAARIARLKSTGGATYKKLQVSAMAPRPFINPPGAREAADSRTADFWARTFARSGVGG